MSYISRWVRSLFITPESIGRAGENAAAGSLQWTNFLGRKGKVIRNLYVPTRNGNSSEIDLLYLTQKGIFVLECKNYAGYIFGSDHQKYWTKTVYMGKDFLGRKKVEKYQFYNPIWQNEAHIRALKNYLHTNLPMFSLIVFSNHCELMDVSCATENTYVCHENQLSSIVRYIWNENPDVLTDTEVTDLFEKLQPLTSVNAATVHQHQATVQHAKAAPTSNTVCPRCGGKLVLRTARNGPHPGSQFYGCSNYPKCKYTKNL